MQSDPGQQVVATEVRASGASILQTTGRGLDTASALCSSLLCVFVFLFSLGSNVAFTAFFAFRLHPRLTGMRGAAGGRHAPAETRPLLYIV